MKLTQIKKQWSVVVVTGLLCATSVFAQHQGSTNGPANSTYPDTNPLATVDTILTHAQLSQILFGCEEAEALRIARILLKNNNAQFVISDSDVNHQGHLEEGYSGFSGTLADYNSSTNSTSQHFIGYISFAVSGGNIYFDIHLYDGTKGPFQNLWLATYGTTTDATAKRFVPSLSWTETFLPNAIDEYGQVNEEKVVASDFLWRGPNENPVDPSDLTSQYVLVNANSIDPTTGARFPIKGVTFDMAAVSACINTQVGLK